MIKLEDIIRKIGDLESECLPVNTIRINSLSLHKIIVNSYNPYAGNSVDNYARTQKLLGMDVLIDPSMGANEFKIGYFHD